MAMQPNRELIGWRSKTERPLTLAGRDLNRRPKLLQLAALPFDHSLFWQQSVSPLVEPFFTLKLHLKM